MATTSSTQVCGVCGDRIGVYEPIWLALDDGTFVASALLNLDEHRSRINGDPRLFHADCIDPDEGIAITTP